MNHSKFQNLLRRAEGDQARRQFRHFIKQCWPVVEPAKALIHNWHIDAIGDHLQAVAEGQIHRLLITVPPGHTKTLITSVAFSSWVWIDRPQYRSIYASYASDLAIRDSVRCRALLKSPWYQETFKPEWRFAGDQDVKSRFENDRKGFRMAVGVNGEATGFRGHLVACDDPLNAREQHATAALEKVIFWWDQVMSSRLIDPANGAFVIIMQRLSERDLAAHVLCRGGYEHLNLPTEFEPERCSRTSLKDPHTGKSWCDPRTEPGELLFPQMYTAEVIAEAKIDLGAQGFAAQHQQRPAPAEGSMFKRNWWRFWTPEGANLPAIRFRDANNEEHEAVVVTVPKYVEEQVQSWDCSFKAVGKADFVAGHLWGRLGADAFLLDRVHGRMNFTMTLDAIRNLSRKWPGAEAKLIEDKANGTAVIQTLAHELTGIIAVNPLDGKVSRAHAVTPRIEAGNVYLPHPAFAPWVLDFIEEFAAFPNGRYDDDVDAATQALARLSATPRLPEPIDDYDDDDDFHEIRY